MLQAPMPHSLELTTALRAAERAGEIARALYRHNLEVTVKADKSPVTEADVRCEQAIREVLEERFPTYGFYGEETGRRDVSAESVWLVDPIDGTKAFIREYPLFSTQIALLRAGRIVLGVSSAPVFGELAWAERGRGDEVAGGGGGEAYLNGQPIRVSEVDSLERATISSGNLQSLTRGPSWSRYGALIRRVSRSRGYGDFLHYHLLAAGRIDAVLESDVNILDIAACVAIVTAAGGSFTDLAGGPVTLETTSVLATNGLMHASILEALRADEK
jgi:histidinol-phosphatase